MVEFGKAIAHKHSGNIHRALIHAIFAVFNQ